MPKFFIEPAQDGAYPDGMIKITGEDAQHIARSLRMQAGEHLTVCDCRGNDYLCEIQEIGASQAVLRILEAKASDSEPDVSVTLFQGLPKSDKMDFIIQKIVELGITRVVPVQTARSVSKPDTAAIVKKTARWGKIAAEAAKQSGRGILPEVASPVSFVQAVALSQGYDLAIMLYEHNGGTLRKHLANIKPGAKIAVYVGPEGGFAVEEVELARDSGIKTAGMGPRILRTETAPVCALSAIMFATGNL